MPGPTTGRLCPICDSPIEKGATKCSFCGTDLTIFGGESEGAQQAEDRIVKDTFPSAETRTQTATPAVNIAPAKPAAAPAPKVEPAGAMFQCPNCNGMVKESDTVCPHCGAQFIEDETAQFECPACGTLVDASATSCPGCGAIFVEEEEAAEEKPAAQPAQATATQSAAAQPVVQTPAPAEKAETQDVAISVGSVEETTDEMVRKAVAEVKESRAQAPAGVKRVKRPGIGGLFRGGKEEESTQASASAAAQTAATARPVAGAPTPSMSIAPLTPTKRQLPSDPKEQGRELAKLVNDVRTMANIATEKGIPLDDSKDLLDRAIASGRERQLTQALNLIYSAEDKLNTRLRDYSVAHFNSLMEEISVASRLGGNTSKAEVLAKEAKRAAETPDYQAAFVFIDKAKTELAPITGKYNEARDILRKFDRLVKDCRAVGIDNEPLKETYEEARQAFEAMKYDEAESIAKGTTEEIMAQVKTRIGPEIDKAKQMLIEVKMKAESGVGPQITILKSAIKAYKEENYLEALSEIKRFKKEMKRLLSPA